MPHFYFHIADPDGWIRDEEGMELPSDQAAVTEGRTSARDLASAVAREGKQVDGRRVLVVSDHGNVVCEIPVKIALTQIKH